MRHKAAFKELEDTLIELNSLLAKHNVNYSKIVTPILDKIKNGKPSGVEELLKHNGGMGSLNDVYICKENDHNIRMEEEKKVNERYISVLNKVWKTAREL